MSSHKSQLNLPPVEVNRVDRGPRPAPEVVNKVDRLHIPLDMAKAKVGRCVRQGVGDRALKEFGDKGLMGNVCSGEKAPDYLARIYQDPAARRRFAREWLAGDEAVRVNTRTVIEWDEEEKVS